MSPLNSQITPPWIMNSCAGSVFTGGLVTDISTSCYAGRPRNNILPNITQGIGLRTILWYIVVAQRLTYDVPPLYLPGCIQNRAILDGDLSKPDFMKGYLFERISLSSLWRLIWKHFRYKMRVRFIMLSIFMVAIIVIQCIGLYILSSVNSLTYLYTTYGAVCFRTTHFSLMNVTIFVLDLIFIIKSTNMKR